MNLNVDVASSDVLVDLSAYRSEPEGGDENKGEIVEADFKQYEE